MCTIYIHTYIKKKAQSVSALCIKYAPQVISQKQNGHQKPH